jgi:hypothetical protein
MLRPGRTLRILAAAFGLLVAGGGALGWHLGWQAVARQLEAGFAQWVAARRTAGWTVWHGTPTVRGWPLAARLTIPDLSVSGAPVPGAPELAWWTERLELAIVVPRLRELVLSLPGQSRLRWDDEMDIPFAADRLTGVVPLTPGVPPRQLNILAEGLRAGLATGAATIGRATLTMETTPDASEGESALTAELEATDAIVPTGIPLPPPIQRIALRAAVSGPMPSVRLPPGERIQQWREGGGAVTVDRVELEWAGARLVGAATLALDDQEQPMGTAEARLTGAPAVIEALGAARVLSPAQAALATVMARAMARPQADGGPPALRLNATLQDSTFSAPPLPPVALPRIVWFWSGN